MHLCRGLQIAKPITCHVILILPFFHLTIYIGNEYLKTTTKIGIENMSLIIHREHSKLEKVPLSRQMQPLCWNGLGFSIHLLSVRHLVQHIVCTDTMVTLTVHVNQFASKLKWVFSVEEQQVIQEIPGNPIIL